MLFSTITSGLAMGAARTIVIRATIAGAFDDRDSLHRNISVHVIAGFAMSATIRGWKRTAISEFICSYRLVGGIYPSSQSEPQTVFVSRFFRRCQK